MKNLAALFVCFFACMIFSTSINAKNIAGVELPDSLSTTNQTLTLNGAGVRTKLFFDIYAAGLYLSAPSDDAQVILQQDEVMALRLHIVSGLLSSEKMKKATLEGFELSTNGNMTPIKPTIDKLINAFQEDIVENDVFEFVYSPASGIQVFKNGQLKTTLKGLAFKQAFFGIWLGEKPTQKSLKKKLLGQ